MSATRKFWILNIVVLAVFGALGLLAKSAGGNAAKQATREADGARLIRGAIDMHFHVDPRNPAGGGEQGDFGKIRVAAARGMRGLVLKHHYEPSGTLAFLLRLEMPNPNFGLFGGIALNLSNGGINPAAVEYMATRIQGAPGKVVWMPAGDTEAEARRSKQPNLSFAKTRTALPSVGSTAM